MENIKNIVNFFFELMHLKRIKRSGWLLLGIEKVDSVAEHCFIAAQIAYILAKMENADAEHAAIMTLFHDNAEARIADLNLIQSYYLKSKRRAERKAFFDQVKNLPSEEELRQLFEEFEESITPEAVIARDADRLELAIQAKCYIDIGNSKSLQNWLDRTRTLLKTNSASRLINVIEKGDMNEWWRAIRGIKKERKRVERELGKSI